MDSDPNIIGQLGLDHGIVILACLLMLPCKKKNKKEERKFDVLFTDLETEEEGGVS